MTGQIHHFYLLMIDPTPVHRCEPVTKIDANQSQKSLRTPLRRNGVHQPCSYSGEKSGCGLLRQFPPFRYFPKSSVLSKQKLVITFIFVKNECDAKKLTDNYAGSKILLTEKLTNGALVTPTPERSCQCCQVFFGQPLIQILIIENLWMAGYIQKHELCKSITLDCCLFSSNSAQSLT